MSIETKKDGAIWVAHGFCSVGPVYEHGISEGDALLKAQQKIRSMHHQYMEEQFAAFRAKYPEYMTEFERRSKA